MSLAIAYSGGADSTALLLMLARQHPGEVQAIHIHHGLQAAADDFAAHCTAFCAALKVPLQVLYVQAQAVLGDSPEDAARQARYKALASHVLEQNTAAAQQTPAQAAIKSIAIAQHADDQVETLLLALSRGAGLPGLASMPAQFQRGGVQFVRPLLAMSAPDIRLWLAEQGLAARHPGEGIVGSGWIEDPTNADIRYTRNRIRHEILPALEKAFPAFRQTFARSARHAAQAQRLLTEVAIDDMARIGIAPQLAALQSLTFERQANVLRHWLKTKHQASPSTAQLEQLQRQIAHCTDRSKQISIKVASGWVRRQAETLVYSSS